jgi:hypothetical protein
MKKGKSPGKSLDGAADHMCRMRKITMTDGTPIMI